jgi:hypothetical protein
MAVMGTITSYSLLAILILIVVVGVYLLWKG